MSKVLTVDGTVKIGAYMFPDRKKPMICKEEGNTIIAYGSFRDRQAANEFMNELGKLVGAKIDGGENE